MKNRLGLLLGCFVILSLCLSPQISYELNRDGGSPAFAAATQETLYVPSVRASVSLAPTLTGSAAAVFHQGTEGTDREQWAPLVIETPESDHLALAFDGAQAFVLEGVGEPGADIEFYVNNAPQSRKVATVDAEGRWRIGVSREDLREGEVYCSVRYVYDWASEAVWCSRLSVELPELRLPAYVAAGTKRFTGFVQGDVQLKASAERKPLLCLQSHDGSFSVIGVTNLAAGTEIVLTAVDALGNKAEAVCMVVRPESATLQFAVDAPQSYQYLREAVNIGDVSAEEDAPEAQPPPEPTAQLFVAQPTSEPTAQPTVARSTPEPEPTDEAFFPKEEHREEFVEAYATLEGMTLPEIDASVETDLFSADVRKRLRDMRRQMALPVDLSAIGPEGLEIPLLARGYRVGSVWIDPALSVPNETGEEADGYVFSLDLRIGALQGRGGLQITRSPEGLDPLKAQGWNPVEPEDDTFYSFDEFVEADGVVLIYACVPLRFDVSQAEPYVRDTARIAEWRALLPAKR